MDQRSLHFETGELCALDANTGKTAWKLKLGIEQRTSTPLFADGKLYVPVLSEPGDSGGDDPGAGSRGAFYIVQPGDTEGKILCHVALEGRCFGSPAAFNGKIYVQTTKKLYCFGTKGDNPGVPPETAAEKWPAPGPKAQLQIIPAEVLLKPGEKIALRVRALDANGFTVEESPKPVAWEPFIPPTAKVKSTMKAAVNDAGQLVAAPDPAPSAGMLQASLGDLHGYLRGRILPKLPLKEDFEEFNLTETNAAEGASFAKTIDNKFFQRAQVFIGHPDMKNYTVEADVLSDGNKRKMSDVGVINQRYVILLKGNEQKLEVNSNLERLRVAVPFKWSPNEWYHLKTRVDIAADGSGTVRAKAWKRGEPEPDSWTIEVPHRTAHRSGSPGLFGFAPQDMRVYIDNITVTPND